MISGVWWFYWPSIQFWFGLKGIFITLQMLEFSLKWGGNHRPGCAWSINCMLTPAACSTTDGVHRLLVCSMYHHPISLLPNDDIQYCNWSESWPRIKTRGSEAGSVWCEFKQKNGEEERVRMVARETVTIIWREESQCSVLMIIHCWSFAD